MNAHDFKKRLMACKSPAAVEQLLQGWAFLQATLAEYAALREAVIVKMDELHAVQSAN